MNHEVSVPFRLSPQVASLQAQAAQAGASASQREAALSEELAAAQSQLAELQAWQQRRAAVIAEMRRPAFDPRKSELVQYTNTNRCGCAQTMRNHCFFFDYQ